MCSLLYFIDGRRATHICPQRRALDGTRVRRCAHHMPHRTGHLRRRGAAWRGGAVASTGGGVRWLTLRPWERVWSPGRWVFSQDAVLISVPFASFAACPAPPPPPLQQTQPEGHERVVSSAPSNARQLQCSPPYPFRPPSHCHSFPGFPRGGTRGAGTPIHPFSAQGAGGRAASGGHPIDRCEPRRRRFQRPSAVPKRSHSTNH
jgi:hypothetical protein